MEDYEDDRKEYISKRMPEDNDPAGCLIFLLLLLFLVFIIMFIVRLCN